MIIMGVMPIIEVRKGPKRGHSYKTIAVTKLEVRATVD